MPVVDPEAAHLEADAKAEARQAAEIVNGQLLPHEVVVPYAQPEIFPRPDEEFSVEDKVAEEIIEPDAGPALLSRFFPQKEHRGLGIRVVVEDVPAVEVPVDDGKAEWQVAQTLG